MDNASARLGRYWPEIGRGDVALHTAHERTADVGDDVVELLAQALESNQTVRELYLEYEPSVSPSAWRRVLRALWDNEHVTDLYVHTECLDRDGWKELGDLLGANTPLRAVFIQGKDPYTSTIDMRQLVAGLAENAVLTHICISDVSVLRDEDLVLLAGALRMPLRRLHMIRNTYRGKGAGFAVLARHLASMPTLIDLDITDNGYNASVGRPLGDLLRSGTCALQRLVVKDNPIGDGIVDLCHGLAHNNTLRILDMSTCIIDAAEVQSLAKVLASNTSIRQLYLGQNMLRSEGALALATAAATNRSLRVLSLTSCGMYRGCYYFAIAIKANPMLQELALDENDHGGESAIALLRAAATNSTLLRLEIDLGSDTDNDDVAMAVAYMLCINKTLKMFDSPSVVSVQGADAIAAGMCENDTLEWFGVDVEDDHLAVRAAHIIDAQVVKNRIASTRRGISRVLGQVSSEDGDALLYAPLDEWRTDGAQLEYLGNAPLDISLMQQFLVEIDRLGAPCDLKILDGANRFFEPFFAQFGFARLDRQIVEDGAMWMRRPGEVPKPAVPVAWKSGSILGDDDDEDEGAAVLATLVEEAQADERVDPGLDTAPAPHTQAQMTHALHQWSGEDDSALLYTPADGSSMDAHRRYLGPAPRRKAQLDLLLGYIDRNSIVCDLHVVSRDGYAIERLYTNAGFQPLDRMTDPPGSMWMSRAPR